MSKTKPLNVHDLFEASLLRLRTEAKHFSRLTAHRGELGRLNETHLVNLLRAYLPPRIGIGTGFIQCGGGAKSRQSPQCDIVLYDALNGTPLYQSQSWSIYPIEMVYGVIEVKTKLKNEELKSAFVSCTKIRAMAGDEPGGKCNKAYKIRVEPPPGKPVAVYEPRKARLPPEFFVFAYDGWQSAAKLREKFELLAKEHEQAHIHGVCCLTRKDSLFVGQRAFKPGKSENVETRGFHHFLLHLPALLDSMVPIRRIGMGFDLTDFDHYTLAEG